MILSLNHLDTEIYLEILFSLELSLFHHFFCLFSIFCSVAFLLLNRGIQEFVKFGHLLWSIAGVTSVHSLRRCQAAVSAAASTNSFPLVISVVPLA